MTDPELIAKKLAFIETCVRELRELARPELIEKDLRERRFIEHTLQLSIQAMLDVSSQIISSDRLSEPRTNYELFDLLVLNGWVPTELGPTLRRMVGFRNILVHGYTAVDPTVVRTVVTDHLGDLDRFIELIRSRLK